MGGGQLIDVFLKSRIFESMGDQLINAFLKSWMLESMGGQLINAFLKSRMLKLIGGWGSTYKRVLEVADVGIDRGWGST